MKEPIPAYQVLQLLLIILAIISAVCIQFHPFWAIVMLGAGAGFVALCAYDKKS